MNLHQIVRANINAVNPDVIGTLVVSAGYTTGANGLQQPAYTTYTGVVIQEQPVDAPTLIHLDTINIQGVLRSFFLNGNVEGIDRMAGKGGDILQLADGTSWLVVHVVAPWDTAGWCHVVGQLQAS